jgi:hypothetical protein
MPGHKTIKRRKKQKREGSSSKTRTLSKRPLQRAQSVNSVLGVSRFLSLKDKAPIEPRPHKPRKPAVIECTGSPGPAYSVPSIFDGQKERLNAGFAGGPSRLPKTCVSVSPGPAYSLPSSFASASKRKSSATSADVRMRGLAGNQFVDSPGPQAYKPTDPFFVDTSVKYSFGGKGVPRLKHDVVSSPGPAMYAQDRPPAARACIPQGKVCMCHYLASRAANALPEPQCNLFSKRAPSVVLCTLLLRSAPPQFGKADRFDVAYLQPGLREAKHV